MYYSFSRLVNATNPKAAFDKINVFEEHTPFQAKPIMTFPVYNDETFTKARQVVSDMLSNDLCDYSLPQMLCIDCGAKVGHKKHNYIIFGFYHT